MDVYNARMPWPAGTKIAALRIIQLLPKTTPIANQPRIGYGNQKSARKVLGTVPVEPDGSAYFRLPVNRPVYFQALDANGLAVQSMRSATYVHPGEKLVCKGCHDRRDTSPPVTGSAAALRRKPSQIRPEPEGSNPFSFPRLVQPVLDKHCVSCHNGKKTDAAGKTIGPDLRGRPVEKSRALLHVLPRPAALRVLLRQRRLHHAADHSRPVRREGVEALCPAGRRARGRPPLGRGIAPHHTVARLQRRFLRGIRRHPRPGPRRSGPAEAGIERVAFDRSDRPAPLHRASGRKTRGRRPTCRKTKQRLPQY